MARSVLVTFMERNKKIDIPGEKEESDLSYLTKVCKQSFSFGSNVTIEVTFQKYDHDWESFVDLEEEYVACHKDKLKLVVSPLLNDNNTSLPSSLQAEGEVRSHNYSYV